MQITVGAFGFVWNDKTAWRLWGPIDPGTRAIANSIGVMRLIRDGEVYDTAEVRRIMPFRLPQFYGLQRVCGTPYNRNIVASQFALGDSIEIDLPDNVDPTIYWDAMHDTV